MERLTISDISSKTDGEPLQEDMRLINAIVNSGITQLIYLNLYGNDSWFANSEAQSYLMDFIKQQTCLKSLDLHQNYFRSAATTQIISLLIESSCIETMNELIMYYTCDFSSDETCALFASFLDKAH